MTEQYIGSVRLNLQVKHVRMQIEACLNSCALFTEAGVYELAQRSLNMAEVLIKQLRELWKHRRGKDRARVEADLVYYGAWKKACFGRLDVTKSEYRNHSGFQRLRDALSSVERLTEEFYSSEEYADLAKKINDWLIAAHRRTIEPSTILPPRA